MSKLAPKMKNPDKLTARIQRKLFDRARTKHKRAMRKFSGHTLDTGIRCNERGWL